VRFWDSSAVVPLVSAELQSLRCRTWLRRDPVMLVWALAATEVVSALSRKRRDQALDARALRVAQRRLKKLEAAWNEIVQLDAVRSRARELLGAHDLRAADALHLAAALLAREQSGSTFEFVTFDRRLATATEREGFTVLSM
jgi:predicted nucleic acid-binding protein